MTSEQITTLVRDTIKHPEVLFGELAIVKLLAHMAGQLQALIESGVRKP